MNKNEFNAGTVNYFKGLDTLRGIAAIVVVVGHIELLKRGYNVTTYNVPSGHIAVILFFVLSGFLITYLLNKENERTGDISVRKFYLRRIFRIWPVYYLVILLSFLIFQDNYSIVSSILCLTIFPNIAHALGSGWPTSPQIWSIGVEEQFYLFWPLLYKIVSHKKLPYLLIIFFIGYSLMPYFFGFINSHYLHHGPSDSFVQSFFYGSKFNSLSLGCLLGFLCVKKRNWLKIFYNKIVAYSSIILSLLLWFMGFELTYFNDEFYTILFGIMILNIATNDSITIYLDNKISVFFGKISYGIYMYHWIVLLVCLKFVLPEMFNGNFQYNLALYSSVIAGTIGVSSVSYFTYEKFFLKLKKRFEIN